MLIEFSVGNFRSFKERVTLSLEATPDDWLEDTHVALAGDHRLLKSAAIYGPNASGKSNLLAAMGIFRNFVPNSFKESLADDKIPVIPFRLSTVTESAPSHFEIIFLQDGARYRYGLEATPERITSEWLFRQKNSKRETRLFTREGAKFEVSADFKEGRGLQERTRQNALFLSVAAQFNGETANEVMGWLTKLRYLSDLGDDNYMPFTKQLLENEPYAKLVRELARRTDVGIDNLRIREVSSDEVARHLPKDLSEEERERHLKFTSGAFLIQTSHKKYDERKQPCGVVEFNLKHEESAGTRKLIALAGPFLFCLREGLVASVDELEARLHPLLTKALISLFNSADNQRNAQLIYATHDEGLLDSADIRRDQVWFVEKDDFGASRLYSLAEFKVRKEAKFAKEYMLGQFGAVPRIRDFGRALTHAK